MLNHPENPLTESLRNDLILLAVGEVAKLLKLSTRTIWRMVSAGKILAPVHIGGSARWRYRDVKQWLDARFPPPDCGRK